MIMIIIFIIIIIIFKETKLNFDYVCPILVLEIIIFLDFYHVIFKSNGSSLQTVGRVTAKLGLLVQVQFSSLSAMGYRCWHYCYLCRLFRSKLICRYYFPGNLFDITCT